MSWIPRGRERALPLPGVALERRLVLSGFAAAAATGLAARSGAWPAAGSRASEGEEGALDFDAFAVACEALGRAHVEGGRVDPDVYLHRVAALAARLAPSGVPRPELADFGGFDPPVETAMLRFAQPVFVVQWRLAPGAELPAHSHSGVHVVSLCLEGACRVRHFEVEGAAPPPGAAGAFRVRCSHERLLRPGHTTSLTDERDNLHAFAAGPDGALGIDVNTQAPGDGEWSMLALEPRAGAGVDALHDARWTGKP